MILTFRSLLCTNAVHDEEASAKSAAASADSGAPTMYHPSPVDYDGGLEKVGARQVGVGLCQETQFLDS